MKESPPRQDHRPHDCLRREKKKQNSCHSYQEPFLSRSGRDERPDRGLASEKAERVSADFMTREEPETTDSDLQDQPRARISRTADADNSGSARATQGHDRRPAACPASVPSPVGETPDAAQRPDGIARAGGRSPASPTAAACAVIGNDGARLRICAALRPLNLVRVRGPHARDLHVWILRMNAAACRRRLMLAGEPAAVRLGAPAAGQHDQRI